MIKPPDLHSVYPAPRTVQRTTVNPWVLWGIVGAWGVVEALRVLMRFGGV